MDKNNIPSRINDLYDIVDSLTSEVYSHITHSRQAETLLRKRNIIRIREMLRNATLQALDSHKDRCKRRVRLDPGIGHVKQVSITSLKIFCDLNSLQEMINECTKYKKINISTTTQGASSICINAMQIASIHSKITFSFDSIADLYLALEIEPESSIKHIISVFYSLPSNTTKCCSLIGTLHDNQPHSRTITIGYSKNTPHTCTRLIQSPVTHENGKWCTGFKKITYNSHCNLRSHHMDESYRDISDTFQIIWQKSFIGGINRSKRDIIFGYAQIYIPAVIVNDLYLLSSIASNFFPKLTCDPIKFSKELSPHAKNWINSILQANATITQGSSNTISNETPYLHLSNTYNDNSLPADNTIPTLTRIDILENRVEDLSHLLELNMSITDPVRLIVSKMESHQIRESLRTLLNKTIRNWCHRNITTSKNIPIIESIRVQFLCSPRITTDLDSFLSFVRHLSLTMPRNTRLLPNSEAFTDSKTNNTGKLQVSFNTLAALCRSFGINENFINSHIGRIIETSKNGTYTLILGELLVYCENIDNNEFILHEDQPISYCLLPASSYTAARQIDQFPCLTMDNSTWSNNRWSSQFHEQHIHKGDHRWREICNMHPAKMHYNCKKDTNGFSIIFERKWITQNTENIDSLVYGDVYIEIPTCIIMDSHSTRSIEASIFSTDRSKIGSNMVRIFNKNFQEKLYSIHEFK